MSNVTDTLLSPILLLISVPLLLFALLTTSLAFTTLGFRLLLINLEFLAVIIQDVLLGQSVTKTTIPPSDTLTFSAEDKNSRRISRRSSTSSTLSFGGGQKVPDSIGFGVYGGAGPERDYEGIGGWKIPGPDEDEAPWTSMNSRLELLTGTGERHRRHRRSLTSSSLTAAILESWIPKTPDSIPRSPVSSRARTPTSSRTVGTMGMEDYFLNRTASKSTTALDAASAEKYTLRHRSSSSVLSITAQTKPPS
ncbi:hypothetical protein MMC12_006147 [Toensbergia leucococca]|nr:hypothetical protein [Toensbergia leucococca]